jgi:hypothetical protein
MWMREDSSLLLFSDDTSSKTAIKLNQQASNNDIVELFSANKRSEHPRRRQGASPSRGPIKFGVDVFQLLFRKKVEKKTDFRWG